MFNQETMETVRLPFVLKKVFQVKHKNTPQLADELWCIFFVSFVQTIFAENNDLHSKEGRTVDRMLVKQMLRTIQIKGIGYLKKGTGLSSSA